MSVLSKIRVILSELQYGRPAKVWIQVAKNLNMGGKIVIPQVVLVKQAHVVDLGDHEVTLEEGKTRYDDGTTILDTYSSGGVSRG
jgi:hypothetical protein